MNTVQYEQPSPFSPLSCNLWAFVYQVHEVMIERDCWELCSHWTDSLYSTYSGGKSTAALQVSTPVWEQSPIVKAEKQILSHGGLKCSQINNMSAQIVLEKMRRLKFCNCTTFCSLLGITPVHLEASRLMLSFPVIFNPWTAWTTPNPTWPTATFTSQSIRLSMPKYRELYHPFHIRLFMDSYVFSLWAGANRLYEALWCYE